MVTSSRLIWLPCHWRSDCAKAWTASLALASTVLEKTCCTPL
jgi:hypothetical protein